MKSTKNATNLYQILIEMLHHNKKNDEKDVIETEKVKFRRN